jgi:hypothetical protein
MDDPTGALAIVGFFATVLTAVLTLGPIGRAIADRVRSKGAAGAITGMQAQLDDVALRLEDVQRQLADMAERQDFAERLLGRFNERGLLDTPR